VKLIDNIYSYVTKNKLLKNYSIYSIGRVVSALISLVLIPVFTKKLPKNEFGIIGLLWIINPILTRLINLGSDVSLSLKYYKLNKQELSNYLYNTLLVIIIVAILIWTLLVFKINWIKSILDNTINVVIFTLLYISILSKMLNTMMNSFLQLSNKAIMNVIMTITPTIVTTIVTYYFIINIEQNYISYIIGLFIGNGIFGIISIIYFLKNYSIKYFKPSITIIKNLLRIGIPIIPGTIAGLILSAGDRFIIKYFIGLSAVAIYVYGYRFSEYILTSIFQPFQKSLTPVLLEKAAKNFEDATRYSHKVIYKQIMLVTILLAIIIIPFNNLMTIMSSNSYYISYIIFLICLSGILLNNISNTYRILFNHLEKTEINMTIVLCSSIFNLALNILLVPYYGIIASAISTLLSYLLMLILSIIFLNHYTFIKIDIKDILISIMPFMLYVLMLYLIYIYISEYGIFIEYFFKTISFIIFIAIMIWFYPELIIYKNKLKRLNSK